MNTKNLIAKAETTIDAPVNEVWDALVNPDKIKKYMFGTDARSDWKKGSEITWEGEWQGKTYKDKGTILQITPGKLLQYSHFSLLAGLPDKSENYHTVTIALTDKGKQTFLTLSQDNNPTEESRDHSLKNWQMMLSSLKKYIEENKS